MIVKINITDIKDDKGAIAQRIENEYPYMPYMPIIKGYEWNKDNTEYFVILSVIVD